MFRWIKNRIWEYRNRCRDRKLDQFANMWSKIYEPCKVCHGWGCVNSVPKKLKFMLDTSDQT